MNKGIDILDNAHRLMLDGGISISVKKAADSGLLGGGTTIVKEQITGESEIGVSANTLYYYLCTTDDSYTIPEASEAIYNFKNDGGGTIAILLADDEEQIEYENRGKIYLGTELIIAAWESRQLVKFDSIWRLY